MQLSDLVGGVRRSVSDGRIQVLVGLVQLSLVDRDELYGDEVLGVEHCIRRFLAHIRVLDLTGATHLERLSCEIAGLVGITVLAQVQRVAILGVCIVGLGRFAVDHGDDAALGAVSIQFLQGEGNIASSSVLEGNIGVCVI